MTSATAAQPVDGLTGYAMLVDGGWRGARSGRTFRPVAPYRNRPWAVVPHAGADDVDDAVRAARRAFDDPSWRDSSPAERARLLRALGALIEANAERLAHTQVTENGKLLRETLPQTRAMAGYCTFFAGVAETVHGDTVPLSYPNMFGFTVREPVGVVAAITPWNSPLLLLLWKLCPALAAGNTVVVKPSELTPVSTLELAELVCQAGFPPGVVNVVTGDGGTGAQLVAHPGVDKIAFTGSTETGKRIAEVAAGRVARVSLELGGKSPNIVFADCDLDNAVNGALAGIFAASGQTCMAGSRILVQDEVYDEFAARLVDRARSIVVGDPADPRTELGTVASQGQLDRVLGYIRSGVDEGATLLAGGGRPENDGGLGEGLFVAPTVFGDVEPSMRIAREEIFGPVACLFRFTDEEEAVALANGTEYGLAAGVWTNDLRRAFRVVRRLRAGTVWVNNYRKTNYAMPFGGVGHSGLGRENGLAAVHEYTEVKSVWIDTGNVISDPFNPRA